MEEKLKVTASLCMWCDLLGYGAPFIKSKWRLNTNDALKNLKRIDKLKFSLSQIYSYPLERILLLNDGFIRNVDALNITMPQLYLYWLRGILIGYYHINSQDCADGNPGARAILTVGERFSYLSDTVTEGDITQATSERKSELSKNILVYSPKEFQMNTAFSKAYIMEESGSEAGLYGKYLYIDYDFLIAIENLMKNKPSHYLLIDNPEIDHEPEIGEWVEYNINEEPVKFDFDFVGDSEQFVWSVYHTVQGERELLFQLFFDKQPVEYNNKGIETTIYRTIKFKWNKDELISLV